MQHILIGIAGVAAILVVAVALSYSPLKIRLRVVIPAFLLQQTVGFGKMPAAKKAFIG